MTEKKTSASQYVLSYIQINNFFESLKNGKPIISFDLGLTRTNADVQDEFLLLPDGTKLAFQILRDMMAEERYCFLIEDSEIKKLIFFSENTKAVYRMIPTADAPALEISGILMHRIKRTTPWKDAQEKINFLKPEGSVLDTNCGFGYTASLANEHGCYVITVEVDENVLELARHNPWSRTLFESNERLRLISGDIIDIIDGFEDSQFDCILHDPPTLGRAENLYSTEFYSKLYRVLRPKGKLFHYIGSPGSRARGLNLMGKVKSKLKQSGFNRIITDENLESILAIRNL